MSLTAFRQVKMNLLIYAKYINVITIITDGTGWDDI